MAANDWLFEVGVDTSKADATLKDFVSRTSQTLKQIPKIEINVSISRNAIKNVQDLTNALDTLSKTSNNVKLNVDASKAAAELGKVQQQLQNIVNGAGIVSRVGGSGFNTMAAGAQKATESIQRSTAAIDWLGKVFNNTMFKFLEFQVIGKAIEGSIRGIADGLKLASDIQLEQTLQGLYNPQVFDSMQKQNQALRDASAVAVQWGADIRDVLQVQGLWTKQTNDLAAATYLANQAEMMHRASGIETMDVYRDSIALATQLGVKLSDLPNIYNQVAEASLKIAVPLKNYQGGGGNQEAMKDIFKGLAESAATLKSVGFDTAGAVAAIATQVQATGQSGETAARNLSSMFAALEGSGVHRSNFLKIIGTDAKDTGEVLDRMLEKLPEIKAAYAKGDLGVRPSQYESMNTFLSNLTEIKKLYDDIKNHSDGKLKFVSDAEMNTLDGQMARLRANSQLLEKSFGDQLLPKVIDFVQMLNGRLLPTVTGSAGALVQLGQAAMQVGLDFLAWQGVNKAINSVNALLAENKDALAATNGELAAGKVIAAEYGATELQTGEGIQAATDRMVEQQRALDLIASKLKIVEWETKGLSDRMAALGVTEGELATVMETRVVSGFDAAKEALLGFGATAMRALGPLLAIQATMSALQGISDSFDQKKNMQLGLQDYFGQRDHPVLSTLHHLNPFNWGEAFQATGAVLSGRGSEVSMEAALGQILHTKSPQGSIPWQIQQAFATWQRARAKGEGHAADVAEQQIESLWNLQYDKHHVDIASQAALDTITPEIKRALAQVVGNGAQEEPPYGKSPAGPKGQPTPEDLTRHSIENVKRDQQGIMTRYQQEALAAEEDAKRIKDLAAARGWDASLLKQYAADYQRRIEDTKKQADAADQEVASLKKLQGQAQQQEQSTRGNVKEHEKAKTNLSMLTAALEKAEGHAHALRSEMAALNAELGKNSGSVWVSAILNDPHSFGLSLGDRFGARMKGPSSLEGFRQEAERAATLIDQSKTTRGLSGEIVTAQDQADTLKGDLDFLYKIEDLGKKAGLSRTQLQPLITVINAVGTALANANGKVTEATNQLRKLGDEAEKTALGVGSKVTSELADILGIPKKESDADYLSQLKDIVDQRNRLVDIETQIGNARTPAADAARMEVQYAAQELDLQEKLLPIYERIQQIRASAEYKALNESLDTLDKTGIERFSKSLFDSHQWARYRKGQFSDKAKPYTPEYGGIGNIAEGFFSKVMEDHASKANAKLTDAIFGANAPKSAQDQLKEMYKQHDANEKSAAQMMLDASNRMLQAAGIHTGAPGTDSHELTDPLNENVIWSKQTAQNLQQFMGNTIAPDGQSIQVSRDPLETSSISSGQDQSGYSTGDSGYSASQPGSPQSIYDRLDVIAKTLNGGSGADSGASLLTGGSAVTRVLGNLAVTTGQLGDFLDNQGYTNLGGTFTRIGSGFAGVGSAVNGFQEGGLQGGLNAGLGIWQTEAAINPALAASPIGIGIAAAGGLIAAFTHHPSASDMPDVSEPTYGTPWNYGQFVANIDGSQGSFNGQVIDPQAQFDTLYGNQSLAQQIAQFIGNPQDVAKLQPNQQALVKTILGLEGSMGAAGLGIASEKNGQFTLDSGQKISVQSYMQDMSNMYQIMQGLQQTVAPLISMNAYGAGPGGLTGMPYNNMYGLTASEQEALVKSAYGTNSKNNAIVPGQPNYAPTSPYATPGVGTSAPGASTSQPIYTQVVASSQPINITTTLTLNGQVLATAVNAVNAESANRSGSLAA